MALLALMAVFLLASISTSLSTIARRWKNEEKKEKQRSPEDKW